MGVIQVALFYLFYVAISFIFCLHGVVGRRLTIGENLEHNTSNISHRMIIKTGHGDIYDCVELYKQPAFQHPLLKNHKIKVEQNEVSDKGSPSNLTYGLKEGCPVGTVPIRRTTKEEQLLAKAIFQRHFQPSADPPNNQQDRFAGLVAGPTSYPSLGQVGAAISIHNPKVGTGQLSGTVISAECNGKPFETIRAGWMVYPDLYNGDGRTRLFTSWGVIDDSKGIQKGCFNTYCSGFVQVSPNIIVDMVIDQISTPGGEHIDIKLKLQIRKDGTWDLLYGDNNELVGYWPNSLFSCLNTGAAMVSWGGWVSSVTPNLPMMGTGNLGDRGSIFRRVSYEIFYDGSDITSKPDFQISQNDCYKVGLNPFSGKYWGDHFWYGGNGGNVNQCPN